MSSPTDSAERAKLVGIQLDAFVTTRLTADRLEEFYQVAIGSKWNVLYKLAQALKNALKNALKRRIKEVCGSFKGDVQQKLLAKIQCDIWRSLTSESQPRGKDDRIQQRIARVSQVFRKAWEDITAEFALEELPTLETIEEPTAKLSSLDLAVIRNLVAPMRNILPHEWSIKVPAGYLGVDNFRNQLERNLEHAARSSGTLQQSVSTMAKMLNDSLELVNCALQIPNVDDAKRRLGVDQVLEKHIPARHLKTWHDMIDLQGREKLNRMNKLMTTFLLDARAAKTGDLRKSSGNPDSAIIQEINEAWELYRSFQFPPHRDRFYGRSIGINSFENRQRSLDNMTKLFKAMLAGLNNSDWNPLKKLMAVEEAILQAEEPSTSISTNSILGDLIDLDDSDLTTTPSKSSEAWTEQEFFAAQEHVIRSPQKRSIKERFAILKERRARSESEPE